MFSVFPAVQMGKSKLHVLRQNIMQQPNNTILWAELQIMHSVILAQQSKFRIHVKKYHKYHFPHDFKNSRNVIFLQQELCLVLLMAKIHSINFGSLYPTTSYS